MIHEYDWMGRRIRKQVYDWVASAWSLTQDQRFLYDGWNVVAILNSPSSILQTQLWGTDLSGSLQGAGGVGGLLALTHYPSAKTYFTGYDGNGNVTDLIDGVSGLTEGNFEYGPFGELIRVSGTAASVCPWRFSTKYEDAETGMLYYGYRFYNPNTGRWLSRDPIAERGGKNLYAFVENQPTHGVDRWGLDQYKAVCSRRDELADKLNSMNSSGELNLAKRFYQAQLCILNALCTAACCTSPSSSAWLNRVVDRFMGNLLDALNGDFYPENATWKDTLASVDGLSTSAHFAQQAADPFYGAGSEVALFEKDALEKMVDTHINKDLRQALMESGVGRNSDWRCIGDVVNKCEGQVFLPFETWMGKHILAAC